MVRKPLLFLVKIYQKVFTLFSYGSCRYYPTCSEYTVWRLEQEPVHRALLFSVLRILRCNQLFRGGIDYPVVKREFDQVIHKKIPVKYWYVPRGDGTYYLIKTFKGK